MWDEGKRVDKLTNLVVTDVDSSSGAIPKSVPAIPHVVAGIEDLFVRVVGHGLLEPVRDVENAGLIKIKHLQLVIPCLVSYYKKHASEALTLIGQYHLALCLNQYH